jgi:hypothetical protein
LVALPVVELDEVLGGDVADSLAAVEAGEPEPDALPDADALPDVDAGADGEIAPGTEESC